MKALLLALPLVLGAARIQAPPTISIDDVTATEGNVGTKSFVFTVTLSAPAPASGVTVDYVTSDVTTTVTSDYAAKFGTLTFAVGETTQTISVTVYGDTTSEADETFRITLSNGINATVLDAIGVGTIQNDDGLPVVSIAAAGHAEGNAGTSNLDFTVTLSFASGSDVTVNYKTADGSATVADADYTDVPAGVLVIPAGNLTGTISIVIHGDAAIEPHESFQVQIQSAVNATVSGTAGSAAGTIANDDALPYTSGSLCGALGLELLLPLLLALALRPARRG